MQTWEYENDRQEEKQGTLVPRKTSESVRKQKRRRKGREGSRRAWHGASRSPPSYTERRQHFFVHCDHLLLLRARRPGRASGEASSRPWPKQPRPELDQHHRHVQSAQVRTGRGRAHDSPPHLRCDVEAGGTGRVSHVHARGRAGARGPFV